MLSKIPVADLEIKGLKESMRIEKDGVKLTLHGFKPSDGTLKLQLDSHNNSSETLELSLRSYHSA